MTSRKQEQVQWPAPLKARNSDLGEAVREYAQSTEETRGEPAASARAVAGVDHRSRRLRKRPALVVAGLAVAGVCAITALALHRRPSDLPRANSVVAKATAKPAPVPPRKPETTQPTSTPALTLPAVATIRLGTALSPLPAGKVDIVGQATAVLSTDAVASGHTQAGATEIALSQGNIELHVLPREPGHVFAVRAGGYRFTVVGTAFIVAQTKSTLQLSVSEGTVAVSRGTQRLARINARGHWAVDLTPSAAPSARQPAARTQGEELAAAAPVMVAPSAAPALAPPPAQTTPPAPAPSASVATPDCGALAASKRTHEAIVCYQARAARTGLSGETAQYDLARLLRDSLGEPERALAAFREQRARFPNGALRPEADLSIIELLPRLGRHSEALVETDRYLATYATAERRGEIHLLRGNIFREVLHDLDKAEREYARGAEASGRNGDDCRFLRAVCLEARGRKDEARKAYETYVLRGGAAHVQEAKDRLGHLGP